MSYYTVSVFISWKWDKRFLKFYTMPSGLWLGQAGCCSMVSFSKLKLMFKLCHNNISWKNLLIGNTADAAWIEKTIGFSLTQPQETMIRPTVHHWCEHSLTEGVWNNIWGNIPACMDDDDELSVLGGIWKRQLHLPISGSTARGSTGQSPWADHIHHFGL